MNDREMDSLNDMNVGSDMKSMGRSFAGFALIMMLINIVAGTVFTFAIVTVIYFFLAAMGLVPPADVIPFVPYV